MTTTDNRPLLTKQDFLTGVDCPRRLWLSKCRPELRKPLSDADRERMRVGAEVGKLARQLYPDGVMAWQVGNSNEEAANWTATLIREGCPSILEATFIANGCIARVDALRLVDGGTWLLEETKSSTVKEPAKLLQAGKVADVAFQSHVVRESGLKVAGEVLVLINSEYRWPGGGYDPHHLLGKVDVSAECTAIAQEVSETVDGLKAVLSSQTQPEVETNTHCHGCDYYDHCHKECPEHDVVFLPLIRRDGVRKLRHLGYHTIDLIADDHKLSGNMKRARDVVVSGNPFVSPDLRAELERIALPAAFIDFESCCDALPQYVNVRPYVQVCFQWSAHILNSLHASAQHLEFLNSEASDPRHEFCRSLWDAIRDCATIVYYSTFEVTQVRAMAEEGIPHSQDLVDLLNKKGLDLEKVVRDHVYFAGFKGRTSIKSVLPVLVPAMSYDGLAVNNGDAASTAYREMVTDSTPVERRKEISRALLVYCKQDTLAMLEVFRALNAMTA